MSRQYPLRFYMRKKLLDAQLEMVDLIENAFVNAGYSRDFAAMAVVNAYAESKLVPTATLKSSKEDSAGLFMLNKKGGLGVGMPTGFQYPGGDSRKDAQLNTERILKAITDSPATKKEIAGAYDWRSIMDVWVHRIERPNGKHFEVIKRLNTASDLFPQGIDGLPVDEAGAMAWSMSGSMPKSNDVVETETVSPWFGRLVVLCVAGIAATWYAREQAKKGKPLPGMPRLER
jgi:hypothetical protein